MSKSAKSARALKRKKEKAGRKASNTARYAAMRDAGQNQKSKRARLNAKRIDRIRTKRNKKPAPVSLARQVELDRVEAALEKAKQERIRAHGLLVKSRKEKRAAKLTKHLSVVEASKLRAEVVMEA